MLRRFVIATGALGLGTVVLPRRVRAAGAGPRISGPFVHENLAIYLVHGASQPGPAPLSLAEAMASGKARVIETRDVNRIEIEILGDAKVFLQSGDIVKGGQQDRVLMMSQLLDRAAGRVAIDVFCVEQGRWQQRGNEDVRSFASARAMAPSRETKLAMKAPIAPPTGRGVPVQAETMLRQQQVWSSVDVMQDKLSRSVGARVASPASQSSLQLALESERLAREREAYLRALARVAEHEPDVVGYAAAINGRVDSAEIYAGNGLFRKMWPKLIEASATQALGERGAGNGAPPAPADIAAFLVSADAGRESRKPLAGDGEVVTRDGDKVLFTEAVSRAEGWLHRSYVAK